PAADVHFMRPVVQGFARTPAAEPVPVIRLIVIVILGARRRALPQIPVELLGYGRWLAGADGLARVRVPALGHVGRADEPVVNLVHDLDGVRRRALLRT